jgi:hypothetical protein
MDGSVCGCSCCSTVDLFNGQWMIIVCHGLKVHIVIYIYNDDEILWEEAPWLYVAKRSGTVVAVSMRECTDLMYLSFL